MRSAPAWVAVVMSLVAACSAPAPEDEPLLDPALLTCVELHARIRRTLDTVDRACTVAEDCWVYGAVSSCNCTLHLASRCSGIALARAAVAAHPLLTPDLRSYEARCSQLGRTGCDQLGCSCDCSPARAECVGGTCQTVEQNRCFADAGW